MTTKTQRVSDEVWAQLDPKAGALTSKDARRIAVVTALVAVVGIATAALWTSGAVRANLAWSNKQGDGGEVNPTAHTFSTDVVIRNGGWTAVRVTGIGGDTAGLHFTGNSQPHISTDLGRTVPFTLQSGQTAIVAVDYTVTDCQAVTSAPFDVPVRVDRFWGTETVGIRIPQGTEFTDTTGVPSTPRIVEWQRSMADQTCRTRQP